MYIIEQGSKFRKDLKRYSNDKKKLLALKEKIQHLERTGTVPKEYGPHPFKGIFPIDKHPSNPPCLGINC